MGYEQAEDMNNLSGNSHLVEMQNISKAFPGVQALESVSIDIERGEIHGLVGENGAGKSTLIKILSGAYSKDSGRLLLEGEEVEISQPSDALELGIVTIYQEFNLAYKLSVAENIYMGRLPKLGGLVVNWRKLHRDTEDLLKQLNVKLDSRTPIKELSAAERQMVEIAKALSISAKLIVLDEPTAALTVSEVDTLFSIVRQLRDRGVSIVFITHRLREVLEVADRVTILRDGKGISTNKINEIDEETIVMHMVGRKVDNLYTKRPTEIGDKILQVEELEGKGYKNVSFSIRSGEIVGFFGLIGSGRTEVGLAIFGAEPIRSGTIELTGSVLALRSPKDAIQSGLAMAPEDRKAEGLVLGMPVRANISLPSIQGMTRLGFIRLQEEKNLAHEFTNALDIRTPSIETPARSLSGGNQQKVVIAKWLARKPILLILDEPTRGIDVVGKAEVHNLMNDLTEEGVGILMISSELPEVLGMSDRILVMREGEIVAEIGRKEANEELVMSFAAGQAVHEEIVGTE